MQSIKRSSATKLLEEVATQVAAWKASGVPHAVTMGKTLELLFKAHGLSLPRKCTARVHRGGKGVDCKRCAPHWEWIFKEKGLKVT